MRHNRAGTFEIARYLVQSKIRWQHPLYLIHAVTYRCNARCGFCAWHPDFYKGTDELNTEEVKELYRDARKAGFIGVSMWGGEPLVRRDLAELARYAQGVGLRTHVVTNGALLEAKMDDVVPHLDRICISVDHPSARHDELRGVKGLWGRILSATLKIRAKYPEKKIVYVYTFFKQNVDPAAIEEMAQLMKSLDVVGVFNAMRLEPAADAPEAIDISAYNPSAEELVVAFRKVEELKRRGFPIVNSRTHLDKMQHPPLEYRCHWPKFMLPVEANGDVVDCMHWGTDPVDNVRNTPLSEILKSPRLRALAGEKGEACHKCVSLHRVEISEAWEGKLEPLVSWGRSVV